MKNAIAHIKKLDPTAYNYAHQHKMYHQICDELGIQVRKNKKHKKRVKWTLDLCREDALKYKTLREWDRKNPGAVRAARINGWLIKCDSHFIKGFRWTLVLCKTDALKYKTRIEWKKKSSGAYAAACKYGWLERVTSHMPRLVLPRNYWTFERCKQNAKKYKTSSEWENNSPSAYGAARSHGWVKKCASHFLKIKHENGHWTYKKIKNDAAKYKTINEWRKASPSAYAISLRKGWNRVSSHLKNKNEKWTSFKNVKTEALKYKSISEWKKNSESSYSSARKNGWLKKSKAHMKRLSWKGTPKRTLK